MSSIPAELWPVLENLADRLIPAADGMPAAGAVLRPAGVDRVLEHLPDLREPVTSALQRLTELPEESRLAALQSGSIDGLGQLGETVAAAYFLIPGVADRIGYHRREAVPIAFDHDLVELTRPVLARGWHAPPDA